MQKENLVGQNSNQLAQALKQNVIFILALPANKNYEVLLLVI